MYVHPRTTTQAVWLQRHRRGSRNHLSPAETRKTSPYPTQVPYALATVLCLLRYLPSNEPLWLLKTSPVVYPVQTHGIERKRNGVPAPAGPLVICWLRPMILYMRLPNRTRDDLF